MRAETELTTPVDLCLPSGRLDPAAVGFSRTPLHRANLTGWGRRKRWEYWGVVTPTHVVGVVLSHLDYAGLASIYVLDRETGTERNEEAVVPLGRGALLPERCLSGTARSATGKVLVRIEQTDAGAALHATAPGIEIDLDLPATGQDSLAVVVPFGKGRFQYTVKDLGRPVQGRLRLDGVVHGIDAADSFAVLDHGRGKWPYSVRWNWAAGAEPGNGRAVQLGGRWTDGTGSTENGVFVDGRLHKISQDLRWSYQPGEWDRPWRIEGERVRATLHPFHVRTARTNLLVLASATHQAFGTWSGWAVTDDGDRVDLDGLVGWAEEAVQRW